MFKASIVYSLLRSKLTGEPAQVSDDQLFLFDKDLARYEHQPVELIGDGKGPTKVLPGAC